MSGRIILFSSLLRHFVMFHCSKPNDCDFGRFGSFALCSLRQALTMVSVRPEIISVTIPVFLGELSTAAAKSPESEVKYARFSYYSFLHDFYIHCAVSVLSSQVYCHVKKLCDVHDSSSLWSRSIRFAFVQRWSVYAISSPPAQRRYGGGVLGGGVLGGGVVVVIVVVWN
jgi:hypothetical protein